MGSLFALNIIENSTILWEDHAKNALAGTTQNSNIYGLWGNYMRNIIYEDYDSAPTALLAAAKKLIQDRITYLQSRPDVAL